MSTVAPSASYSLTVRVAIQNRTGMLGRVAMAIGDAGGDIGAVDLVESGRDHIIRDITINARDSVHGTQIVNRLKQVTGVRVVNISDRTFLMHLALHLDLATEVHQEGPVRDVDDAGPGHLLEPVDDLRAVDAVPRVDGDVADDVVAARLDQVHGADVAAGVTDGHGDAAQHAGPILYRHADGEAITGARRDCGHSSLLPSPGERSQLDAATSPMAGNPNPGDEGSFMARGGWTSAGSHVVEHARPIE